MVDVRSGGRVQENSVLRNERRPRHTQVIKEFAHTVRVNEITRECSLMGDLSKKSITVVRSSP